MLRETWSLGDVRDVEAFCGDVIAKFTRGERAAHKPGSDAFFSQADKDDALAYLLGEAWIAWRKFNPVDDGRGTNKFSGYLVWILHRRLVDFMRLRFGSTRYPNSRIVATLVPLTPVIEERIAPFLDPECDSDDYGLDLESAPAGTREALELLQPLIDEEVRTIAEAAERAQVPPGRVTRAVAQVRAVARQQGLEPHDEERRELADQAAELRERGLNYRETATALGLRSTCTARALLVDYHPSLVERRGSVKSNGNGAEAATGLPSATRRVALASLLRLRLIAGMR